MPGNDGPDNLWRYASAGMEFIITFGLFLGAGFLVDRWLKSMPAFTLIGAVAGFAGGLQRLVKVGRDFQRRQKDSKKDTQVTKDKKDDVPPPPGKLPDA